MSRLNIKERALLEIEKHCNNGNKSSCSVLFNNFINTIIDKAYE
jgi:hypothetical protein